MVNCTNRKHEKTWKSKTLIELGSYWMLCDKGNLLVFNKTLELTEPHIWPIQHNTFIHSQCFHINSIYSLIFTVHTENKNNYFPVFRYSPISKCSNKYGLFLTLKNITGKKKGHLCDQSTPPKTRCRDPKWLAGILLFCWGQVR